MAHSHSPFLLKWREDKYHQPPKAPLPELTTWGTVDRVQKVTLDVTTDVTSFVREVHAQQDLLKP